jgi:type VI secretion system protein ImpJ
MVEALVRSPSLHPYALYLALCAQLGLLSRLRPGAVPLQPPPWNQADPMTGLEPLLGALEDLAGDVSQDWRCEVFRFDGRVFELPLQASWIDKRLILGMRGRPETEQSAWLEGAVIGSRTVWTSLSDRRMLGAPRQRIHEAPELSLRANSGYTLFAVEPGVDFVVAEQPLLVSNANESSTIQRPLELVLFVKG